MRRDPGVLSALLLLTGLTWTAPAWCAGTSSDWRSTLPLETPGYPQSESYTPGDELWWDGFGLPSIDGQLVCTALYRGFVIAGGHIEQAGGRLVNNIARWDGVRWEPLGSGLDGPVAALIVWDGDLIAAGWFQRAGGIPSPGIARWNGTTWSAMGPGLHSEQGYAVLVSALAVHDGDLVAGGEFTHSGTTSAQHIARWDGTSWSPMGEGTYFHVRALAVTSGALYAGGEPTYSSYDVDYVERGGGLAKWNGATWEAVGGGLQGPATIPQVEALSTHGDLLVVGGSFSRVGDLEVSNIASWDGATWASLGGGIVNGVNQTFSTPEGLLYAGGVGLRVWDGESWSTVPGLDGAVRAIHSFGGGLLVGGSFKVTGPGNDRAFHVARYSNGVWQGLEPWTDHMRGLSDRGRNAFISSFATYGGRLVATGTFDHAGDPPFWNERDRIAEWDGRTWLPLPSLPGARIPLAVEWSGELHVVGDFPSDDPVHPIIPAYRLSSNGWEPLPAAAFRPSAIMIHDGALLVSGTGNPVDAAAIYRWAGAQWQVLATAAGDGFLPTYISSMVELDGRLVVAGRFTSVSGVAATNVAAWDGARWEQFGTGLPGTYSHVAGLAVYQGSLVATGTFSLPGIPQTSVVRWNGSQWEAMGTMRTEYGRPATAYEDLFLMGPILSAWKYVGVARWDGQDWVELGSGTNAPVLTVIGHGGQVYLGGGFSWAGGKSAFGMARWSRQTTTVAAPTLAPATPNPFRSSTSLTYGLTSAGSVRVAVYDAMGREIASLDRSSRSPGTHSVTWNGKDQKGNTVPAGVYFIRAVLPGNAELARKVVRLR